MNFKETFGLHVAAKTQADFILTVGDVRFSILSPCLLRVERGAFTDAPTQKVWYRDFERPAFQHRTEGRFVVIETERCVFRYDLKRNKMASVTMGGKTVSDFRGGNLKGTYRTLDGTIGPIPIGKGIVSKNGVALLDDSKSLLLGADGRIEPRPGSAEDLYYFAFGHNYREAVQTLFQLTGPVPLVPRFCLGNWWSRYKAYSQQEYMELMEQFIKREIPITVATIDMDWHWVKVKEKFGDQAKRVVDKKNVKDLWWSDGWTGYSWNTDLFPDYKGFLSYLKSKNLKITVNVHPSDGVRFFEDQYADMANAMGIDPASQQTVQFDITDPKFIDAYFTYLHHPYEKDGVDFWWIDWQQGHNTKLKGLDPLWALNHYHYLDNCKENRRGLILSRYAEIGSHRYPLGFSGDTTVSWPCYRFQPYFTSTAANVGYTWWSHDIGGHHRAKKEDELYLRWVQFGVFSPVNRLHSTSNEFMGKEPWKFRWDVEQLAMRYLRLRHRLIPYLYTMNYRTYHDGVGLIEPMYYDYPESEQAYRVKNEYLFGSELIVAPVTRPLHPKTNLAGTEVWLPEGRYTDLFTNQIYEGGRCYKMFRGLESLPVLAKTGAILPLDRNDKTNQCGNPDAMELLLYRGNNSFTLYEDDGESQDFTKGAFATREFTIKEDEKEVMFSIHPYRGDTAVVRSAVDYRLTFRDIISAKQVEVQRNGQPVPAQLVTGEIVALELEQVKPTDEITVWLKMITPLQNRNRKEALVDLISKFQEKVDYKRRKFDQFVQNPTSVPKVPTCYREPIQEILSLKKPEQE